MHEKRRVRDPNDTLMWGHRKAYCLSGSAFLLPQTEGFGACQSLTHAFGTRLLCASPSINRSNSLRPHLCKSYKGVVRPLVCSRATNDKPPAKQPKPTR